MTLAAIPSPTTAVWHLGPIPLRAYALFIVLGIVVACVVTEARLRERGAPRFAVLDLAVWAVPFGIVGGRLYHVITTPELFFGEDGSVADIVKVWEGGLGIWGGIAGGAVGVWLASRQLKLPFLVVADAAAVGIPLAQAIGRLGNWFNNELYGSETGLPWGLRVYQMSEGRAVPNPQTGEIEPLPGLYHPTFLYEALWCVGVAVLVWWVGRRLRLGRGRQFALYVMGYTAGRFWIEMLRIDDTSELPGVGSQDLVMTVAGQRINVWVSVLVFLLALGYFLWVRGPQEYLLPVGEDGGFRIVDESEFLAHQQAVAAGGAPPAVPPPPSDPPPSDAPPEDATDDGVAAAGASAGASAASASRGSGAVSVVEDPDPRPAGTPDPASAEPASAEAEPATQDRAEPTGEQESGGEPGGGSERAGSGRGRDDG